MAFDDVAIDERSVASMEPLRHAVLVLEVCECFAEHYFLIYFETIFL
jgi:hypothetical protein